MTEEVLGVFPCIVRKQSTSLYITTDRIICHSIGSTVEDSQVILLSNISGFQMNKPRPELPPEQQKALIKIQYRDVDSTELRDRVIDFTGDDRIANCGSCEKILRENAGDKAEERRARLKRDQKRVAASRRLFLAENPDAQAMYVYLTGEGGLSVDDFWDHYSEEMNQKSPEAGEEFRSIPSGAIPAPLRRPDLLHAEDFSSNVLTVTTRKETEMTREKAGEIFLQFPKAKELFDQLVPSTISEKNFWKRFFHSQYFNLSQGIYVPTGGRADAVFDSLVTENEKPGGFLTVDPEIDLTTDYLLGDSGVFAFGEKGAESGDKLKPSETQAHSTLISRFNRSAANLSEHFSRDGAAEALNARRHHVDRELDQDPIRFELSSKETEKELSKAEIEKLRKIRPLRVLKGIRAWTFPPETSTITVGMEGVAKSTLELTAELVAPASLAAKAENSRKARRLEASPEAAEVNEYVDRVVELLRFFYASKLSDIEKREKLLKTLQSVKNEITHVVVPRMKLATEWTATVNMIGSMVSNAESLHANLARNSGE